MVKPACTDEFKYNGMASAWYSILLEATKAIASMPFGHCLGALEMLTVQVYNFLIVIGCPLPRRKCLGALSLSKLKHTGLNGLFS